MKNIYFYILIMCAVDSFAKNGKTKIRAKSHHEFNKTDFEEEAIHDFENLFKDNPKHYNENNISGEKKVNGPKSIYKGSEHLNKQVNNLLKWLNIKKVSGGHKNYAKLLRSGNDNQFEDLTPSARYKQFINNLDRNHRNAIKSRSITLVGDSKFDDMFKSDKNNRFEQIMKKLGSQKDSIINEVDVTTSDFSDRILRQGLDYEDTKPGLHTAILITNHKNNDKNKESEEHVQNQHTFSHKLDNAETKEINPIMRVHPEIIPVSLPPFNNNVDQVDELMKSLNANQKHHSKSTRDSLKFHSTVNTENIDEPPQVLKTSEAKIREDIKDKLYPDNDWLEHQPKISTNRIEDVSDSLYLNYWQNDGPKPDRVSRDHVNDLLLRDDNNYWKNVERSLRVERKVNKNELFDADTDWQKLLKRFSMGRLGDTRDVLYPNSQMDIVRRLDVHFKEEQNNGTHSDTNDNWKFLDNPDDNFQTENVRKRLPDERTQHKSNSYYIRPQPGGLRQEIKIKAVDDDPDYHGRRSKRSAFTQAGYTHDPDICQLYNENLAKLWSNLSKYINATEQPNERALHNIAIMIEAYLEHQNLKQSIDHTKVKHEGSRDKITETILRIKKLLDDDEGSTEKITKIITKYIKPFYGDVENEDCQQVNEESLNSSVELLYKNYLENSECHNDGEGIARNKKSSLRKLAPKSSKYLSSNTELKPEIKSIISDDELYKDFHRGKMPRQRTTTKNRRRVVYKRGRKPPIYRSGDENVNDSEKSKTRSKISHKTSNKRSKKSSRKSDLEKTKCEKYAIRKFTVSMRPVIERFMALLECQLDNTLRSLSYKKVSMDPYYLYASKYYSNEDNRREKKILPRMKTTRKHSERNEKTPPKKNRDIDEYDNSNETGKDVFVRENSFPWVRKYILDKPTSMNSPIASRNTGTLESNNNSNNENNEYNTNFNEYFQSPPLYDDYDGIYKAHVSNYPSFVNPLISVNKNIEKKGMKSESLKSNPFYEDEFPEEPKYIMNIYDQEAETNTTDDSGFKDLTKLRGDDQTIAQTENTVKKLESITDFLRNARDESLQTPEFAVPFALDSNKGYVELTHLVKYPKMLVYRPQFIVKNTMPYDDFLKTINNFNMTNDQVRLMKIVRHLPDSSVKVLFQTEDFDSPLEVRNIKDNRRSGSRNYPLESRRNAVNTNINFDGNNDSTDETGDESLITIYRDEFHRNVMDVLFKSDRSRIGEDDLRISSDSYLDSSSENNSSLSDSASYPASDSGASLGLLPSLPSSLISNITESGSNTSVDEVLGSTVGSQVDLGIDTELDSASSLGSTFQLNPIHSSQLSSHLTKLLPSYSNSESNSNKTHQIIYPHLILNATNPASISHSYSPPNSLLSSRNPILDSNSESTIEDRIYERPVNQWWKWWKNIFKRKIKKIVGSMATLAESIDHIIRF